MNIKFLASCIVAVSSIAASASTINFATGGGRGHMFVSDGNRLVSGSLVRVGYVTTAGDVSTFQEFATTTISHPSAGFQIGGFLTNPASSDTIAAAAKGKQIYLWVYNAATAAGATASAIFTSTDTTWVIPANFTGASDETSNLSLSLAAGAVTAIQDPARQGTNPSFTRGPVTVGATTVDGAIYSLGTAIPEPGSATLALLALAAVGRRRRA